MLVAVARGDVDFGVTYIGTRKPEIVFEPLFEERIVVARPMGHRLSRQKRVTWAELARHEYVTIAQGSGNRFLIEQALNRVWDWGVVPRMAIPPRVSSPLEGPTVTRLMELISRRGRALMSAAQLLYDMLLQTRVEG